jgi:protein gp37
MSDGTKIEWTDATWNVINGCSVTSPGCTNCYAMRLAGTRMKSHPTRAGLTVDSKAGPVWTGEVRFNEKVLLQPLRWRRPRRIFVCAHGDLFHDAVPDDWIDRVFAVMALAPQHQFQVLTKRPQRMRAWFDRYDAAHDHNCADMVADAIAALQGRPDAGGADRRGPDDWPLPNVWLGVSVEDQARADERIPDLLATPAAVRWLSCEPLLGPVDLTGLGRVTAGPFNALTGAAPFHPTHDFGSIDWVVAGGESGPGARPMNPAWARQLRDACAQAGTPFLFKQWGEWVAVGAREGRAPIDGDWPTEGRRCCRLTVDGERRGDGYPMQRVGKAFAGRLLDGRLHDGFPA